MPLKYIYLQTVNRNSEVIIRFRYIAKEDTMIVFPRVEWVVKMSDDLRVIVGGNFHYISIFPSSNISEIVSDNSEFRHLGFAKIRAVDEGNRTKKPPFVWIYLPIFNIICIVAIYQELIENMESSYRLFSLTYQFEYFLRFHKMFSIISWEGEFLVRRFSFFPHTFPCK